MDANGLRFWMIADMKHWQLKAHVEYDDELKVLRLASERVLPTMTGIGATADEELAKAAKARLDLVPQTLDAFDTRAFWDGKHEMIVATGAFPGDEAIFGPLVSTSPTDLVMGYDGVLYIAVDGRIIMQDRLDRWEPFALSDSGFKAWRLAADPEGGVWALDSKDRKLARVKGLPLPNSPYGEYSPDTFRPCEENPDPPRLIIMKDAKLPEEEVVAIACSPEGRLAVLTWAANGEARLRCLKEDGGLDLPTTLSGARYPYSMAWVSANRLAVLTSDLPREAPAYAITKAGGTVDPVGDFYPLRDHTGGPFLHGVSLPPHYSTTSGSTPLHHLSLPSFAPEGTAANQPTRALDSGSTQTVWHRLYLEADIPPNCGIRVYLAATDRAEPPSEDNTDMWHEHRFGEMFSHGYERHIPRGAWVSSPSEIPYHPGLLQCPREKNRSGLFTALIQRTNRLVRTLRGQYIHVRVQMIGDRRETPRIAGLRLYASRFSYLNRYLPELYHEDLFGEDADRVIPPSEPSTPADFLERFLDNFEGVLTPLEDRIGDAYLLTDARTTPEEALEWLGSWIGVTFDSAYPLERRRRLLQHAPELFRRRGTLDGLKLALNLATGNAVDSGEVVILEDFLLRRTFMTILGADLADEKDPLLGGIAVSGNSYVGDTLFLGDEGKKDFLALFGADLLKSPNEEAAVAAFLDKLAYRVTVLVHQEVEPQDLGLIRRVVALETPAHILAKVLTASYPLLVGMASLVGVDTYLGEHPRERPVTVDQSRIGVRDFLQHPASLDPRYGAPGLAIAELQSLQPVADAGEDVTTRIGESFTLDGSRSYARGGKKLDRYIWTRID